jgi:hypothetical protein
MPRILSPVPAPKIIAEKPLMKLANLTCLDINNHHNSAVILYVHHTSSHPLKRYRAKQMYNVVEITLIAKTNLVISKSRK